MNDLSNRIQYFRAQIQKIQSEGFVAPAKVWISEFSARNRPGGKIYHYFKLMQLAENKVKQLCYLGKPTNPKYGYWHKAIERRNHIQKLERIIARLEQQLVSGESTKQEEKVPIQKNTSANSPLLAAAIVLRQKLLQKLGGKTKIRLQEVVVLLELIQENSA
ncbi:MULTISPECIES: hypothetical protein [Aerosakkonema]|uniref:hypothetical protein n=1 Tax=Aerosakkonema TaxID=1246629 RepID=UPI0035BA6168